MVQTPDRWRILPAIGGEGLPPSTRLYGHLQGFGLHDQPKFSELFMSHLLARNVRVEADLVDQLFNSSEKRLARLLLSMANFGKEGRPERPQLIIQHGFACDSRHHKGSDGRMIGG
jgi:hypothetical protein